MSNPEQLSSVIGAFEQWRRNKKGRQVPTPAPLRQQAVALLDNHFFSKITSALRISGTQLKQWTESLQVANKPDPFVNLPLSANQYVQYDKGRSTRQTNARGIIKSFYYNDKQQLQRVEYSNDTPTVSYSYDEQGRIDSITDGTDKCGVNFT